MVTVYMRGITRSQTEMSTSEADPSTPPASPTHKAIMSMVDNYTHFESMYKNHMQEAAPVLEQVEKLRNALELFREIVAEREKGVVPDFPVEGPTLELRNALETFREAVAEHALEAELPPPAEFDIELPTVDKALQQTADDAATFVCAGEAELDVEPAVGPAEDAMSEAIAALAELEIEKMDAVVAEIIAGAIPTTAKEDLE